MESAVSSKQVKVSNNLFIEFKIVHTFSKMKKLIDDHFIIFITSVLLPIVVGNASVGVPLRNDAFPSFLKRNGD